jgi:hypothetical protein
MAQSLKYAALLTVLSLPLMASPHFCIAQPAPTGVAQQPSNPPAEEEKPVKVFTEEILLPVLASDERGRFDPGLTVDDVLVLEEGVPQQVRSVRRLSVNLLLLIDLGGEVPSPLKTTCELIANPSVAPAFSTCAIAQQFIDALGDGDSVAVLQNSGRVEVLQDWTTKRAEAALKVRTRLFSSARSRLAECLSRAAEMVARRPAGNTHIVIITSGAEGGGLSADSSQLTRRLTATQATLHVISYSAILRESLSNRNFGLDFQMRRRYKRYGEAIKQVEARLQMMVREIGGEMFSPADEEEVARQSRAVVNNIKLQYVITYKPARPFGTEGASERRRVAVGARRVGLRLVSLRDYVTLVRP